MMVSRRLQAAIDAGARGDADRAGPHGAVPRPVQLRLLARRVRRRLPAAPAQRRLPAPDRRRQPARPGRRAAPSTGSKPTADDFNFDGRQEVQLANDKLVALLAPSRGGHAVRARRPLDLPQPAGHAHPPARGLSPQGAGRRRRPQRRGRRPATAWSSSRTASTSGCNTTTTRARAWSITSTTTTRRWTRSPRGEAARAGRLPQPAVRSPLRRNPRPHAGAADPRRQRRRACRCGSPRA